MELSTMKRERGKRCRWCIYDDKHGGYVCRYNAISAKLNIMTLFRLYLPRLVCLPARRHNRQHSAAHDHEWLGGFETELGGEFGLLLMYTGVFCFPYLQCQCST